MPARPRLLRLPMVALLLLGRPAFGQAPSPPMPGGDLGATVEHVLFDLGEGSSVDVPELYAWLAPHGSSGAIGVLSALESGRHDSTGGKRRGIDRRRREALQAGLGELPAYILRLEARSLLAVELRLSSVELGLAVVGALGRDDQLATAFALAETGLRPSLDRRVPRALERALVQLLQRHPALHDRLAARFQEIHPGLRWNVVRAVGEAGRREGLRCLGRVLGEIADLDQSVLTEIGRLALAHPPPHDWSLKLKLRAHLHSLDARLRREAAGTLARMQDRESFAAILALLDDPERGVRENALWALRSLSGKDLGPHPGPWQLWHDGQMAWFEGELPGLIRTILGREGPQRVHAVGELARRPFFRHELSQELSGMLSTGDPVLLLTLCGALADLGSHFAVPGLVSLLEHPREEIVERAWNALRRITGEDRPSSPEAWLAFID